MRKKSFVTVFLSAILIGAGLRIFAISGQCVLEDEWWPLIVATEKPLGYILTHYHQSDHCIPLTALYRIILQSIGLGETTFRLPQMIAGIALIIFCGWIVKKVFGTKTALVFSFFVALSPILIFYSRIARPYSIAAFLGMVLFFSFLFWMRSKKRFYLALYGITAILLPYFHLLFIGFALAPLLFAALSGIRRKEIIVTALAVTAGISLWFLPAAGSLGEITRHIGGGSAGIGTVLKFLPFFCGTANIYAGLIVCALVLRGVMRSFRFQRGFLSFFTFVFVAHTLTVFTVMPSSVESPIVLTRYFSVFIPFYLLFAAIALADILEAAGALVSKNAFFQDMFFCAGLSCAMLYLFFQGPLVHIYTSPNNFTNHNFLQYNYRNISLLKNKVEKQAVPAFYARLKDEGDIASVIEYPYLVIASTSPYFLYQRVHRKRVKPGYSEEILPLRAENARFNSMVNVDDVDAVYKSGCGYLIVHKDIFHEAQFFLYNNTSGKLPRALDPHIKWASEFYRDSLRRIDSSYSDVVYEDKWLKVFRV